MPRTLGDLKSGLGKFGTRKTFGVIGIPKLTRALKDIRQSVEGRRVKAIYLEAAQSIAVIVHANAPRGADSNQFPKKIRDAVEVGVFKSRRNMIDAAFVLVNDNDAPHAKWTEFGTANREHSSGKSVGRVEGTNWFARSKKQARPRVRAILFAGISGVIRDTAKRAR